LAARVVLPNALHARFSYVRCVGWKFAAGHHPRPPPLDRSWKSSGAMSCWSWPSRALAGRTIARWPRREGALGRDSI